MRGLKLDYKSITDESILDLSKCDISLLSDIILYSSKLDSSDNTIQDSLNLALTFERVEIFKRVLKNAEPFTSAAREYSELVDSLTRDIIECQEILDISLNRSNTAAETIAKTLEYAEKMALKQLISGEIIDKFHMLESHDFHDSNISFDDRIQILNSKGYNCIESIIRAQQMMENKKYKSLIELIEIKNLELDNTCESLYTHLQDLIKEYSIGSQHAESFFETIYLKDINLPFMRSLHILSYRMTYFNYIIENLMRAKIKRLAQILSMTKFDSINHFLAFSHEIREELKGFTSILNQIKSQNPNSENYTNKNITDNFEETPLNDNPLSKILEEKLLTFTSSHHLKALRLLTFYTNKYKNESNPDFFLEIFEKFKIELLKEFEIQIDNLNDEFTKETLSELESPGIIISDTIDNLINKFKNKIKF